MRKPLAAFGLAVTAGMGVLPAADVLAAPSATSPSSSTTNVTTTSRNSSVINASKPGNHVSGAQIVQTALKYLGYPYTATGNSPSTGFSCIGFASFVYRSNGIPLPGDLADALAYAPRVPFSDLQPGDLLYFQNTVWNGLSHVAIYIGGGKFVHAEYYGYGVRISSFNNDSRDGNYWISKYLAANRPWSGAAGTPVVNAGASGTAVSTAPTVAVTAGATGGATAVVTVSSLNVRSSPSLGASVQTIIPQGTSVTVLSHKNGWYKVQLSDGTIGWVIKGGVSSGSAGSVPAPPTTVQTNPGSTNTSNPNPNIGTPTAPVRQGAPAPTQRRPTVSVSVTGLRVHSSPSVGAPVVTTVNAGQRVTVLKRGNGWMKVRTADGSVGWIVSSYTNGAKHTAQTSPAGVAKPKPSTGTASNATAQGGSVLAAGVRVHSAPGVNAPVITVAAAGTRVKVLSRSRGWALVRLPSGATGYVLGSLVH